MRIRFLKFRIPERSADLDVDKSKIFMFLFEIIVNLQHILLVVNIKSFMCEIFQEKLFQETNCKVASKDKSNLTMDRFDYLESLQSRKTFSREDLIASKDTNKDKIDYYVKVGEKIRAYLGIKRILWVRRVRNKSKCR